MIYSREQMLEGVIILVIDEFVTEDSNGATVRDQIMYGYVL